MVQPLLHLLSDDTTVLRLIRVVVTILMMDRVILFVVCEPLLQKQTTVLFPTINLNSEMQKQNHAKALNTWLIHVWFDNVYVMRIPHLSLSPRRVPRTETSATLHPVALVALEGKQVRQPALGHQYIALVRTQNICRNCLIFSYIGHRLGNLTQSNLSKPFQNSLMIFVSNHPSHCIGHKKHEAAYLTPDLNHFDLKFDRL